MAVWRETLNFLDPKLNSKSGSLFTPKEVARRFLKNVSRLRISIMYLLNFLYVYCVGMSFDLAAPILCKPENMSWSSLGPEDKKNSKNQNPSGPFSVLVM